MLEQMALIIPAASTSSEFDSLHDDYRELLQKSFADETEKEQIPDILRFLQLEYAAKVSQPVWPDIYSELKDIGSTLPAEIQRIDASGQLQSRHLVLLTVATARTQDDGEIRRTVQNKLTAFNGDAQSLADQISLHIDDTSMQRGDQWLGNILEILIRRRATQAAIVSDFVELLRLATRISQLTGRSDVQSELLERLTSRKLKPDETKDIAAILQQGKGQSAVGNTHKEFWAKVVENNPDGSDLWLEATVQLAELAAASGQKKSAKRRLGVTNTLYPDWGNEKRRQRALGLLRELQE